VRDAPSLARIAHVRHFRLTHHGELKYGYRDRKNESVCLRSVWSPTAAARRGGRRTFADHLREQVVPQSVLEPRTGVRHHDENAAW